MSDGETVAFILFLFIFPMVIFLIGINYESKEKKEVELIKNTKDYTMYENCEILDNVYYCYNKIEE